MCTMLCFRRCCVFIDAVFSAMLCFRSFESCFPQMYNNSIGKGKHDFSMLQGCVRCCVFDNAVFSAMLFSTMLCFRRCCVFGNVVFSTMLCFRRCCVFDDAVFSKMLCFHRCCVFID